MRQYPFSRSSPFRFLSMGLHKRLGVPNKGARCGRTASPNNCSLWDCYQWCCKTLGERWSIVSTFVRPPRAHTWRSTEEHKKLASLCILQWNFHAFICLSWGIISFCYLYKFCRTLCIYPSHCRNASSTTGGKFPKKKTQRLARPRPHGKLGVTTTAPVVKTHKSPICNKIRQNKKKYDKNTLHNGNVETKLQNWLRLPLQPCPQQMWTSWYRTRLFFPCVQK
jgi:hypothetical protein